MKVLVTGADGFLGKNLVVRLSERSDVEVLPFTRQSPLESLLALTQQADFIVHLAGVNRPDDVAEFARGNVDLTIRLCENVRASGRAVPIIYTSSTQAAFDNPYGQSKRRAEEVLSQLHEDTGTPVYLFRLPNVFGKWSRPDYNSAVATFCHRIARDLPIQVNDPNASLTLVYVDDVISAFLRLINDGSQQGDADSLLVEPQYTTTVGALAGEIRAFRESRTTLVIDRVGTGLARALYATYVSYLPVDDFVYALPKYGDARGVFVEMLKTHDSGQFSYFTAHPGITRGGHYHHSKTEKFLVIQGMARFRFRQLVTDTWHEVVTTGEHPQVVETVPGWTHDITNIGDDDMIVMLWANELFDRSAPDTIAQPL